MFAVPGWSVSNDLLKTQVEDNTEVGAHHSKKRKRNYGNPNLVQPNVNAGNVAELWGRHIEGRRDAKSGHDAEKPGKKKKSRKEKVQVDEEAQNDDHQIALPLEEPTAAAEPLQKKGKKDKKQKKDKRANGQPELHNAEADVAQLQVAPVSAPAPPPGAKLTPLQASMRAKLTSARFRHLNQTLYTTPSVDSLSLFTTNPEMFEEYHSGFRQQVGVWPENPVDGYIATIRERGHNAARYDKKKSQKGQKASQEPSETTPGFYPLPRTDGTCTIADLGCGDARLSSTLQPHLKKLNLKIHSFDLYSPSPLVTRADIANLPLSNNTLDIAIFCLALMGTSWIDFIEEAWRCLRWKGELWVAEIKSRFARVGEGNGKKGGVVDHSVGKRRRIANEKAARKKAEEEAEVNIEETLTTEVDGVEKVESTNVGDFVEVLRRRGFALKDENSVDMRNKMFVRMVFVKALNPVVGKNVKKEVSANAGAPGWKRKFAEKPGEKEVSVEDEGKALKPCVYKAR